MVTKVNKVLQNGEIKEFCFFKNDSLFELWLYDNSGSVQDFCNENADLSSVQSKRKFLSALGFESYKAKSEFIEYMSELYDNLY